MCISEDPGQPKIHLKKKEQLILSAKSSDPVFSFVTGTFINTSLSSVDISLFVLHISVGICIAKTQYSRNVYYHHFQINIHLYKFIQISSMISFLKLFILYWSIAN